MTSAVYRRTKRCRKMVAVHSARNQKGELLVAAQADKIEERVSRKREAIGALCWDKSKNSRMRTERFPGGLCRNMELN